jgi:hypothetical protein
MRAHDAHLWFVVGVARIEPYPTSVTVTAMRVGPDDFMRAPRQRAAP